MMRFYILIHDDRLCAQHAGCHLASRQEASASGDHSSARRYSQPDHRTHLPWLDILSSIEVIMRPDAPLFFLAAGLWFVQGWLWIALNSQQRFAIFCFVVAIGCAGALKLLQER